MGVMNKVMNFLGLQEEEEVVERERVRDRDPERGSEAYHDEEYETHATELRTKNKANIVSIHSQKNVRVMLTEPRSYEETQEIADYLRSRRPVVVNLHKVRGEQATRIVDFLSGTVYALNGSISKIGTNIFLCTPDTVEIQGSISEMMNPED